MKNETPSFMGNEVSKGVKKNIYEDAGKGGS